MATLPMNSPQPPGRDVFSRALMIGSSIFGGGSALYLAIQLVREQPDRAFVLMQKWGPGYLLAFFCAFAVNRLVSKVVEGSQRSSEQTAAAMRDVAEQMRSIAEGSHAQALATQAIADKDDREKQEMQILIGVVNSKVEEALDEQRQHNKTLATVLDEIKRQNRAFQRIEDRLAINRPEDTEN